MHRLITCAPLLALWALGMAQAAEKEKLPLQVLYLARDDDAGRERAFASFLEEHFATTRVIKRSTFAPSQVQGADVVLLDWSQHEDRTDTYPAPLGELESWSTPTVLLGSAGLLIAGPWQVIGGAG